MIASPRITQSDLLNAARSALLEEAAAIREAAHRLGEGICRAVEVVLHQSGKVIVSGAGKSGHVGQKIAGTLCSTGTPAVFIHPTDAAHGDLGVYAPGDPTLVISKSGSTAELLRLIPVLQQFRSPVIAILGNLNSPLAKVADIVLDARVPREADPLNLAPTCSSTVALALGDALAVALMRARAFSCEDFARCHPAGQLGRHLTLRVGDVMHRDEEVGWISPVAPMREVIAVMTARPLGAACVVDAERRLLGLITDGDLRRALLRHEDIRAVSAAEIMTCRPVTIGADASLKEAATLMEDRPSQLSVLPVVETESHHCLGLVRIHDVYQAELL